MAAKATNRSGISKHTTYTCPKAVGVTGFEPAAFWSQTRRSSQAELHPEKELELYRL